jgi:hypothetical protein
MWPVFSLAGIGAHVAARKASIVPKASIFINDKRVTVWHELAAMPSRLDAVQ